MTFFSKMLSVVQILRRLQEFRSSRNQPYQGHPAKNDHATEALHNFCARATFLRGVPGQDGASTKKDPAFSLPDANDDDDVAVESVVGAVPRCSIYFFYYSRGFYKKSCQTVHDK